MSEAKSPPLKGIKVIELGTLIAGPFCSRILAEFGAEVIKIESPPGVDANEGFPSKSLDGKLAQALALFDGQGPKFTCQPCNPDTLTSQLEPMFKVSLHSNGIYLAIW